MALLNSRGRWYTLPRPWLSSALCKGAVPGASCLIMRSASSNSHSGFSGRSVGRPEAKCARRRSVTGAAISSTAHSTGGSEAFEGSMPCTLPQEMVSCGLHVHPWQQQSCPMPALLCSQGLGGRPCEGHAFQITVCLRALYADTDSGCDMEAR